LIDYCKSNDVIPEAYQSIKKVEPQTIEVLHEIAKGYNKTWQQIVINYQINEGMVVIPKSHNPKHQQENIEVLDFTLSADDQKQIKKL
jgi:diketogulonate reductase-like aldo/keto reductase